VIARGTVSCGIEVCIIPIMSTASFTIMSPHVSLLVSHASLFH